jgi:hypothetical protein
MRTDGDGSNGKGARVVVTVNSDEQAKPEL